MSNSKKFTISMIIEAIDKVTGPIGALTRKVEKAAAEMSNAMEKANKKMARGSGGGRRGGKAGRGGGGFGGGGFGLLGAAAPQIAAVGALAAGTVAGFRYFTKASDDAAQSSARFYAVIKASGKFTKAQAEALKKSSDAIQDKTAIEDDAFAPGFAAIANTVKSTKAAEKLKMTLADLMTANEGLNTTQEGGLKAASAINKAFNGQTKSLKSMGIVVTKAQEQVLKLGTAEQKAALLSKLIGKKVGGLSAAEAATPKGRERQIANQWNNVAETIGSAFDKVRARVGASIAGYMPTLQRAADQFPAILDKAGEGFQKLFGPGITDMITNIKSAFAGFDVAGLAKSMNGWAQALGSVLNPLLGLLGKIIGDVGAAIGRMWIAAQPALQRIAKAFLPIISAIKHLWEKVLGPLVGWLLGTAVPFLLDVLAPAFEFLGKAIGNIVDWLADAIVAVAKWASDMWPKISRFFTGLWSNIKMAVVRFGATLMNVWQSIWDPVFSWVSDKWKAILEIFETVKKFVGLGGSAESSPGGGRRPASMQGTLPEPGLAPVFPGGPGTPGIEPIGGKSHKQAARIELVLPGNVKARILQNNGLDLALGRMGGFA